MGIGNITHTANKQWVAFDTDVATAEQLFKTQYHVYEHTDSGKTSIACDEYHLPSHLTSHVDFIKPGIKLMHGKATRSQLDKRGFRTAKNGAFSGPLVNPVKPQIVNSTKELMLSMCDTYITPACIAAMYNITQATKAAAGNQLGIFEEGDFYAAEDLILYFATFAQNIPLLTEPILKGVDGGIAPSVYAGGESGECIAILPARHNTDTAHRSRFYHLLPYNIPPELRPFPD
jgi:tripeptidyl-peptidase-1